MNERRDKSCIELTNETTYPNKRAKCSLSVTSNAHTKNKNKTWEAKTKKYRQASEWKVKLIKVNK